MHWAVELRTRVALGAGSTNPFVEQQLGRHVGGPVPVGLYSTCKQQ
jgi:hypothetical protein